MKRLALVLGLLIVVPVGATPARAERATPTPTAVYVYKTVAGRELQVAWFQPTIRTSDRPILSFSGNGWRTGSYEGANVAADFYADLGHPAFAVDVSGTDPEYGGQQWPQMLYDAQDAVAWVASHGSLFGGLDTTHVGLSGSSSGGHIALYAALSGTPGVVAVLNFSGPTDLVTLVEELPQACNEITGLLGNCTDQEAMAAASPVSLVKDRADVAIYLNGFAEDDIPFEQQQELADLEGPGTACFLHQSPGVGHGFNAWDESGPFVIAFVEMYL